MFKLVSLSSRSGLFKEIVFKDGLNIILGQYTQDGKDINGIGKTTIVFLIDYCLLADGPKKDFYSSKYNFLDQHSVSLRFTNSGELYRIDRTFDSQQKTKAFFGKDETNLTEYTDKDLRIILGNLVMKNDTYSGVYDPSWFRTIMNFFVQDDHSFLARDANKIEKFIAGGQRKSQLLTYNMFLLGLDNSNIWKFDQDRVELKKLRNDQTVTRKHITEQTGKSVDASKAEVESIERKVKQFEDNLDSYQFESSYTAIEHEIRELSQEISQLNFEHLDVGQKLSDIRESLKVNIDLEVDKIKEIYSEVNEQFADFVCKELDSVIAFRNDISINRSVFLNTREKRYIENLSDITNKIISLEEKRSKFYKRLEEQNAFDAIKSNYETLIEQQSSLESRRVYFNQLDLIEENIAGKKTDIDGIVADIVKSKRDIQQEINEIKDLFIEIVSNSVDTENSDVEPYLEFKSRPHATSPILLNIEVPRSGSLGKGRFKILSYDLTVFLNACINKRDLPRFLIHDGVFHGIAHKTRIKLLNFLNYKFPQIGESQYIITLNEDEIIFPDDGQQLITKLDFNLKDCVIATLEDDPVKMFFGHEFG